jgi:hypothetical protein
MVLIVGHEGVEWIELAEDTVQWRAVLNTVMTFWFHKTLRIS